MNTKAPQRGAFENSAVAAGSELDSTILRLIHGVIEHRNDPTELPRELWDLWATGFREGADRAKARVQPRLDRANADADHWYYVAQNPEEDRKRHAKLIEHTLSAIDTLRARERDESVQAALRRLEHHDPLEYRRLALLRLTDKQSWREAMRPHLEEVSA